MNESQPIASTDFDLAQSIVSHDIEHVPIVHKTHTVMSSSDPVYGSEIREAAQALHTQVYLEKDFIDFDAISKEGLYIDEYSDRSVYLLSENDRRQSACRYIYADKRDGIMSLPTAQYFSVNPDTIKQVAGVARLSDLKSKDVIEVSALASIRLDTESRQSGSSELDATRLLYATILRHSLDAGHRLWLLNIDPPLVKALRILIGSDNVHELGEKQAYMGSPTVPVAINPQDVVQAALTDESEFGEMKRQYLLETLPGVRGTHLRKDVKQALSEHEIPYEEESRLKRVMKNRRALAYTAIMGYSSARALPVGAVEEFEGSVPLLWAIDVGTAVPYTWGLIETVTGKSPARRLAGATVAGGSFVAPYAYFWAEGNDYPWHVNAVVGGLIGTAALLEGAKMRKDYLLAEKLQAPHR